MPIRIDRAGQALPVLAIVGSIVSLCIGASLARALFPVAGVAGTTAYRVGFAALMLLALWRPWRIRAGAAHWRTTCLFGLVLGAMNLSFYTSLGTLPLGVAIALEFVGPLAVSIAGSRRPLDFVWIGCAVLGMVLLLPMWQFSAGLDPAGVAFALLAGGFWAAYILLGRRIGQAWPGPSLLIAYSTCIAHGIDMATSMTHQADAVASAHWPLFRFRPDEPTPLKLDSKAPTKPVREFMDAETRFSMLKRSDPKRAEALAALAQADADERWRFLSGLAGLERTSPPADLPAPPPEPAPDKEEQ